MPGHPVDLALKTVIASTIGFGLLSAMSAWPPFEFPARLFTDLMVWPPDGGQDTLAKPARLAWALLGGFLTSWGVLQWLILTRVGALDRRLALDLLTASVLVWFALDTAASVVSGVPANAVANVFFLLLYMVPIRLARQTVPGPIVTPSP